MAGNVINYIKIGSELVKIFGHAKDLHDKFSGFDKAEIEITATEDQFTLVFKGAEGDSGTARFTGTANVPEKDGQGNEIEKLTWEYDISVEQVDGFFNDSVILSGSIRHRWQPHENDRPTTNSVQLNFAVDTDNTNRVSQPGTNNRFTLNMNGPDLGQSVDHDVGHSDVITTEQFQSTIFAGGSNTWFDSYAFTVTVTHQEPHRNGNR